MAPPAPDGIPQLSVQEVVHRMAEGALLVDVREPDEWAAAHVPDSLHMPLSRLEAAWEELPRDRPLMMMCAAGARSHMAARFLRHKGFPEAANVAGGIHAWHAARLPLAQ